MLDASVSGVVPSPTLAINERVAGLRASGRDVLHLGLGQSPFPVPEHVVAALQANAHQKDYLPVRGLPDLRAAVADYHRRHEGSRASAEDVLVGPGTKELMFGMTLALEATLLLPNPSWVSYAPQAKLLKRAVRWVETDPAAGWRSPMMDEANPPRRNAPAAQVRRFSVWFGQPLEPSGLDW